MERATVKATLVAKETDSWGYTTYVFEVDPSDKFYTTSQWIMCTRYPNWQVRHLSIGEVGFLLYAEVIAGEDKYWDGKNFLPYRYSDLQFMNFISKPEITDSKNIVID